MPMSFWLMTGDVPTGPFTVEEIHTKLTSGEITWQAQACPVSTSNWTTLIRLPQFGPSSDHLSERDDLTVDTANSQSPPSRSNADASAEVGDTKRAAPWNPILIAWLGIPFTPMWAGVMAAINGRRLGLKNSVATPLVIGFGYLAIDIIIGWAIDSEWVSLGLYAASLALLWVAVLRPQSVAFVQSMALRIKSGRWLWPSIAGAPLAVFVILAFVVVPQMPLEPRDVCEKFIAARDAKDASKYTTGKLMPALEAMQRIPDDKRLSHFELTDEAIAPADVGGYLVGWRHTAVEEKQPVHIEGVFHLTQWSGSWKIEELYYTTLNGQTFEKWPALSVDYPTLLQTPSRESPSLPRANNPSNPSKTPLSTKSKSKTPWEMISTNQSLQRSLLMIGLAVSGAIFKGWKSRQHRPTEEQPHEG